MILPGATIGVLGGGQLGDMFALAARRLGYAVAVWDPDPAVLAPGLLNTVGPCLGADGQSEF